MTTSAIDRYGSRAQGVLGKSHTHAETRKEGRAAGQRIMVTTPLVCIRYLTTTTIFFAFSNACTRANCLLFCCLSKSVCQRSMPPTLAKIGQFFSCQYDSWRLYCCYIWSFTYFYHMPTYNLLHLMP